MTSPIRRRRLYPHRDPYETGRLKVSDRHTLAYARHGKAGGEPAVVFHGGPGAGANANLHRYFDPKIYDILVFDQRGCGNSTPHASIDENTTWDLVADAEALRRKLGVERWLVFGGSWGSTLALAYAQSHPERVTALVLRGIFTGAQGELDWFYRFGAPNILPDAYEAFLEPLAEDARDDPLPAHHRLLTGPDEARAQDAAIAWARWEARAASLTPTESDLQNAADPAFARAVARIETHYFVNNCFFDEATHPFAEARMARIRHIPCRIAHGRYDLVTPPSTAWRLATLWPEAELVFAPTAGHTAAEPELVSLLVEATDAFARRA